MLLGNVLYGSHNECRRLTNAPNRSALLALVLYLIVWLLLPCSLLGIAREGALALVWAIVTLPFR